MIKTYLLGVYISFLGFIICYQIIRTQGIAYGMSFAAMLLVGVIIISSSLIIRAINNLK
jgi:hypothetical protein